MKPTKEEINISLIELISKIAQEQHEYYSEINLDTKLREELNFSSMDIIHLMSSIDMRFRCKLQYDLLLRRNDEFVMEFTVAEIADFIDKTFDNQITEPAAM